MAADALRTFTFFALLAATIALVLANRSFSRSMRVALLRHNRSFRYVLGFMAAGAALILAVPGVQRILKFAPLEPQHGALIALAGVVVLAACELTKGREAASMHRA